MENLDQLKRKYYSLIPRSFATKLDLFLFNHCHINKYIPDFNKEEFSWLRISDDIVDIYEKAWSLADNARLEDGGLMMKEIDHKIEVWNKTKDSFKTELFKDYQTRFITDLFPFSEFEIFYGKTSEDRKCHYCQITEKEIMELKECGKLKTKRGRGLILEFDRIKPNYEYTKDNVVLACYWCNNAKTDEFSEQEFLDYIGPGISQVWDIRSNS